MIDDPEIPAGPVRCGVFRDINFKIVPRWSISGPLDCVHGRIANVVVEIADNDHSLCFLCGKNFSGKVMGMTVVCLDLQICSE